MTQELVSVVLLTSVVGLIWVITRSIWAEAHPSQKDPVVGASTEQGDEARSTGAGLKHHTIAA